MPSVPSTTRTEHLSFRLSRPGVLAGHRVKPRLSWLQELCSFYELAWFFSYPVVLLCTLKAFPANCCENTSHSRFATCFLMATVVFGSFIALWIGRYTLRFLWRPALITMGVISPSEAQWFPLDWFNFDLRPRTFWELDRGLTPWPLAWQECFPNHDPQALNVTEPE